MLVAKTTQGVGTLLTPQLIQRLPQPVAALAPSDRVAAHYFVLPVKSVTRDFRDLALSLNPRSATKRDLAMTHQASQIRARYGRFYALAIVLVAVAVAGTVWANSANTTATQATIDVSAIMSTIDMPSLPVQHITDNF